MGFHVRRAAVEIDVEETYARYGPMVLRRCRRLLRDEALALDAMQDTFVRLLHGADRLEDRGLSSLLFRMATQVCLNRLRWIQRHPEDVQDSTVLLIAQSQGQEERALAGRVLDRIFAREASTTRLIAVLHHVDGMTHAEVAAEVGLSESGVRRRLRQLARHARAAESEELDHAG